MTPREVEWLAGLLGRATSDTQRRAIVLWIALGNITKAEAEQMAAEQQR